MSSQHQSSGGSHDHGGPTDTDNIRLDPEAHYDEIVVMSTAERPLAALGSAPAPLPAPLHDDPTKQTAVTKRKLCEGLHNHCFNPEEKNVFSPPSAPVKLSKAPSPAPSVKSNLNTPAPSSFRNDESDCQSDEQGNYGNIEGSSFRTVSYRYQVETAPSVTALELDVLVLQDVEKTISDLMVQRFFAETCSPPPINVLVPNNSNEQQEIEELQKLFLKPVSLEKQVGNGGRRGRMRRTLKTEDQESLVGLSAEPLDQVLEDERGEACPFPTTTGPCFVVGGGLTVYGDGSTSSSTGGLLWVDEGIHEELQASMDSGELEAVLQTLHPDRITAIRYIPPGTELPNSTPSTGPDEAIDEGFIGARTSALSWVLIGLGFFLMIGVFLYVFLARRREMQDEERNRSVQAGAFPVVVTKTNVDRVQRQQQQEAESDKPIPTSSSSSRASNTYAEISRYYSATSELVLRKNQSDSDDDDDEDIHLFHDDDNSPRQPNIRVSTSWRDQILREKDPTSPPGKSTVPSISLDPGQPFVTPILDDEGGHMLMTPSQPKQPSPEYSHYHSAASGSDDFFTTSREINFSSAEFSRYHSAHSNEFNSDAASTLSSSPRHFSSPKRDSPSKLKVAFDRAEII